MSDDTLGEFLAEYHSREFPDITRLHKHGIFLPLALERDFPGKEFSRLFLKTTCRWFSLMVETEISVSKFNNYDEVNLMDSEVNLARRTLEYTDYAKKTINLYSKDREYIIQDIELLLFPIMLDGYDDVNLDPYDLVKLTKDFCKYTKESMAKISDPLEYEAIYRMVFLLGTEMFTSHSETNPWLDSRNVEVAFQGLLLALNRGRIHRSTLNLFSLDSLLMTIPEVSAKFSFGMNQADSDDMDIWDEYYYGENVHPWIRISVFLRALQDGLEDLDHATLSGIYGVS